VEDILIPVWGDIGDLDYAKIGESADIRWITDIEELRNQLACSLRVPLSVLGGFVQEASGALGSQAIEKLSIEFAHSARRLQRAIKVGVQRLCQIHLAFLNMDPDARLFSVNMNETSTAEEESLRESLDAGVDVVSKAIAMAEEADPEINKIEVGNYFIQKLLRLEDFDLRDFHSKKAEKIRLENQEEIEGLEGPGPEASGGEEAPEDAETHTEVPESRRRTRESRKDPERYIPVGGSDLMSFLPGGGENASSVLNERFEEKWKSLYQDSTVKAVNLNETGSSPKPKKEEKKHA